MTQLLARTAIVPEPGEGWPVGQGAIHLSKLHAISLGLRPGQLLKGVLTSNEWGAKLRFAAVTVPLPEHVHTGSTGTLTVQALMTRDGWILRPVTEELPVPSSTTTAPAIGAISAETATVQSLAAVQSLYQNNSISLLPKCNSLDAPGAAQGPASPGSPAIDTSAEGIVMLESPIAGRLLSASVSLAGRKEIGAFLPEFYVQAPTDLALSEDRLVQTPLSWLPLKSTISGSPQADSVPIAMVGADEPGPSNETRGLQGDVIGLTTTSGLINIQTGEGGPPSGAHADWNRLDRRGALQPNPELVAAEALSSTSPGTPSTPTRNTRTQAGLRLFTSVGPNAALGLWADNLASAAGKPDRSWRSSAFISPCADTNLAGPESFTPPAPTTILAMEPIGELTVLGIDPATLAIRPSLPTADANPVRMTDPVARDLGLRDGEIVKGAVKADGDALKLVLNGLAIELPEGHGLQAGDTPTFRVFQSPEGLLLQPLRAPTTAQLPLGPMPAAMASPPAGSNLMSLLLHPNSLTALTQLMSSGLLEKALSALNVPELTAAMRQGRASMSRLTSTGLRKAVAGSGLWAEASFTQSKGPTANDTKLLLLNLLKNSAGDPDIKAALGRGLEDIESAQLQAVQAQTNHELLLNLVIPFSDANPVRLSFHRPAPTREQPDPPYTVNLHSLNDFLGEIWLKTAITNKTQVDMTMWARLPEVAKAASKGSRMLAIELEKSGMKMNSFVVYNGARQDPVPDSTPPGAIVNVQA